MNLLRSAAVSKTSRSASQRSRLLRLAPLCPAHSRAPCANRFRGSMREVFLGRILPMNRNILIRTILPHPSPLPLGPLGEGESLADGWTLARRTTPYGQGAGPPIWESDHFEASIAI